MESSIICERCSISTSLSYLFSCNHSLCLRCILRIITFNHLKTILTQNEIQIACPCQLGTKKVSVADLPQVLEKVNTTSSMCKLHGAAAKLYCFKCDLWLCEDCIGMHKTVNSQHQLTQGQSGFRECEIHQGLMKDLYCHDCQQILCSSCHKQKDSKHSTHKCQFIKNYAQELRTCIPACDISAQMDRIEIMQRDISRQVDHAVLKTMQNLDELIQVIEESKLIYNEKMQQILQRSDIFFHLLKLYYLDLDNCNMTLDIHLLKDLSAWNIQVLHLELQVETEKKQKKCEVDLKEYLKMQPIETIKVIFQKDRIMHPLKAIKVDEWGPMKEWSKNSLTLPGHIGCVSSLIQLADGRIASGSGDKTIKVWEVKDSEFKNTKTLTGHNWPISSIIQLADGRIASGSCDTTIKIWEMKDQEFINTLTLFGHDRPVCPIIQLADGRIASGSIDKTIKIWEVSEKEFKNTVTLKGHKKSVRSLIQLEDGRIASGSEDNTIKVWEDIGEEFKNTLTLTGHADCVRSLIQLADGRIASGSNDKTIKIWEVREKEFKNTLTLIGHTKSVRSIIQLADGRIASGSEDKTIKVWEVKGEEFKNTLTLTGHNNSIWSILQLTDGRIASGSDDRTIKVWE